LVFAGSPGLGFHEVMQLALVRGGLSPAILLGLLQLQLAHRTKWRRSCTAT
jgi:hypothetical protein